MTIDESDGDRENDENAANDRTARMRRRVGMVRMMKMGMVNMMKENLVSTTTIMKYLIKIVI